MLGRGYAGSSSHTGNTDPMADMQEALQHQLRVFPRQHEGDIHHEGYKGSENADFDCDTCVTSTTTIPQIPS
ncbi:hypothetical protein Hanom_Chr15g01399191 [Helianthus anomalus]